MNTTGIVDVLNALPTSKLLSTVSAGIGKLYEPMHIKRIAKAKAEEIKLISGAMEECSVIPTQYNDGSLALNNADWDDFVRRTQGRMAFQELQKQNNIECVVAKTYNILENEQTCSNEPVEQGWINRFFDSVADVSDEDLQKLWSKVLAGEILQPKSYSLRTLETLKNLSKFEAELFEKVAPFATTMQGKLFLTAETNVLRKYGVFYKDILCLDECGLINSDGMVSYNPKISINDSVAIFTKSKLLLLKGTDERPTKISFGIFGLTQAGKELCSILDYNANESYLCDFAEEIEKNNRGNVVITLHQIHSHDGENIKYNTLVLREFPQKQEEEPKQINDQL